MLCLSLCHHGDFFVKNFLMWNMLWLEQTLACGLKVSCLKLHSKYRAAVVHPWSYWSTILLCMNNRLNTSELLWKFLWQKYPCQHTCCSNETFIWFNEIFFCVLLLHFWASKFVRNGFYLGNKEHTFGFR